MDKIWYRNSSKSGVIGRCGGDEKLTDHAEPTIVECKKKIPKIKSMKKSKIIAFIKHKDLQFNVFIQVFETR